jgi:hypothetical protein
MKSLLKKLFIGASLLVALCTQAQLTTNISVASTGYSNLLQGAYCLSQIVVTPPAGSNSVTVRLIDSNNSTNLFFTNAAYIARGYYITNQLYAWTNFFGKSNAFYSLTKIDYTNTVSATGYPFRNLMVITAPAGGTTILDLNPCVAVNLGLSITNLSTTNATVSINYRSLVQ